jgi:hypothetical protein
VERVARTLAYPDQGFLPHVTAPNAAVIGLTLELEVHRPKRGVSDLHAERGVVLRLGYVSFGP